MLSDMTPSLSYTNFPSFQSEMCAFLDMHLHPGYYDHDEDFYCNCGNAFNAARYVDMYLVFL